MKPPPLGWPRISSALYYDNPGPAIDWICKALGFEVRIRIDGEGDDIVHSELVFGGGMIFVGSTRERPGNPTLHRRSPRSLGGANTQALFIYVDDIEAHYARACAAGAKIISEPTTNDYGEEYWADRGYELEDPEGHRWWFGQRIREEKPKG